MSNLLNTRDLFNTIEPRIKSNQNFQLDSGLRVHLCHVRMSLGERARCEYSAEYGDFDEALKQKKSVLRIREDGDHLGLPTAVVTAIHRYRAHKSGEPEPNLFSVIRPRYEKKSDTGRAVSVSKKLARDLLRRAGLPVKPVAPAGVAQIAAIQRILPDYQIQCYTARGGSLIYRGPKASRKIYLILDELKQHYHVGTSAKGWYYKPLFKAAGNTQPTRINFNI